MNRQLAVALLLLVPSLALGQDAKKFNAKQLEQDFSPLAVFHQKGKVVDNEVIVTEGEFGADHLQAVYVVRTGVKKALEFYGQKLSAEPKKEGDEALGTLKYVFALPFGPEDKRLFKVTLTPTDNPGTVQVTLLRRAIVEDDRPLP